MYNTKLDFRLGENRLDGFREAFKPIYAGDQDIANIEVVIFFIFVKLDKFSILEQGKIDGIGTGSYD